MNPAIDMKRETDRVAVEARMRQLDKIQVRYQTDAERREYYQCREWLKQNPRRSEGTPKLTASGKRSKK